MYKVVQFSRKCCTIEKKMLIKFEKYCTKHLLKQYIKYFFLGCTTITMLYNLAKKGCTTQFKTFMNDVVRSLLNIATVQHIVQQNINYCTTLDNMYNIVQNLYNFLFKPIFRLYNFSNCLWSTTFCTKL